MYEVFLNDRKITITAPGKITLNKPTIAINNLTNKEEVKNWFFQFIDNDNQEIIVLHATPETFFKTIFQSIFTRIPAAGGVVVRNKKLLFIFRNRKWDLPKGKFEKGESNEDAALREVEEECGISGHKIKKQLPSTFHIFQSPYKKSKGEWIFKETFWFEMEYSGLEKGRPQAEENITEIKWFSKNDLNEVLENTYANLNSLILLYRG